MTRVFIWKNNSPQEWEEISFSAFSKARRNGCFTGRFFVETVKMFRDEDDRIIMECSRKDFEKYQQEDRHSRYLQEHEKSRSIFPASHVGDRDGTEEGYQDKMRWHISLFDLCCQRNDQKNIGIKITVIVLDNNGRSDAALLGTAVRIQIHHVDIPALVHPVCGHRRILFLFFASCCQFGFLLSIRICNSGLLAQPTLLSQTAKML